MKNKTFLEILRYGLLVFALAYTFVFVIAGFGNHMDPFYWMGLCKEYGTGFMTIGTVALGHAWIELFGASVFTMRLLGWILTMSAVIIPYLCLLSDEQRKRNVHWLAICILLIGYSTFQEFSAGALSVFLTSIVFTCCIKALSNWRLLWLLPILIAIAICVRFPNIVLLVFAPIIFVCVGYQRKMSASTIWGYFIWLLLGTICFTGLLYWLLGCDLFAIAGGSEMQMASSGAHSFSSLLVSLIVDLPLLLMYVGIVLVIVVLFKLIMRLNNNFYKWMAIILLSIVLLCFAEYAFSWKAWYNKNMHYCLSALVIALSIYGIIQSIQEKEWNNLFAVAILLSVGCVVPLGSDTAWLKLFPIYLCFLPYLITKILPPQKKNLSYLYVMIAPIMGFVMLTYCLNPIGSKSLFHGKVFGTQPLYHNVFIPRYADDYLNQLMADYREYGNETEVIAVGDGAHLFKQLTNCSQSGTYTGFWMDINDEDYSEKVISQIKGTYPIIFCLHTPKFVYQDENIGESVLEDKLRELGYETIDRSDDCYMIYKMSVKEE